MGLLPRGFGKGLLLGGLAAVVVGILGDSRRRATVVGPLVDRAESVPFIGARLYSFFAGHLMPGVYRAVATDVLAGVPGGLLLELGAGAGYLAAELGQRNRDLEVVAMNLSGHMVAVSEARVHSAGVGRQVKVTRGQLMDIPYPEGHFDHAVSLGGLHHWDLPELVLAEVYRVLRPGGKALLYSLRRELPEAGWDRIRERLPLWLQPMYDLTVSSPASRAPTEEDLRALAMRTPFGDAVVGSLDVEIGGLVAPAITKTVLSKPA